MEPRLYCSNHKPKNVKLIIGVLKFVWYQQCFFCLFSWFIEMFSIFHKFYIWLKANRFLCDNVKFYVYCFKRNSKNNFFWGGGGGGGCRDCNFACFNISICHANTSWMVLDFFYKVWQLTCLKDCGYILCQCYDLKEDTMHSRLPWSSINGTKI